MRRYVLPLLAVAVGIIVFGGLAALGTLALSGVAAAQILFAVLAIAYVVFLIVWYLLRGQYENPPRQKPIDLSVWGDACHELTLVGEEGRATAWENDQLVETSIRRLQFRPGSAWLARLVAEILPSYVYELSCRLPCDPEAALPVVLDVLEVDGGDPAVSKEQDGYKIQTVAIGLLEDAAGIVITAWLRAGALDSATMRVRGVSKTPLIKRRAGKYAAIRVADTVMRILHRETRKRSHTDSHPASALLDVFAQGYRHTAASYLTSEETAAAERVIAALKSDEQGIQTAAAYAADLQLNLATLAHDLAHPRQKTRDMTAKPPHGAALVGALAVTYGQAQQDKKNFTEAERHFRWACKIFHEVGEVGESLPLALLGRLLEMQDHLEEAEQCYQQALAIDRTAGDTFNTGVDLALLGQVAWGQHRLDQANQLLHQALTLHRQAHDRRNAATTLRTLGQVAQEQGRPLLARYYFFRSKRSGSRP